MSDLLSRLIAAAANTTTMADTYRLGEDDARAVVAAVIAAADEAGFVFAPKEATAAMLRPTFADGGLVFDVGYVEYGPLTDADIDQIAREIWRSMISLALVPSKEQPGEDAL